MAKNELARLNNDLVNAMVIIDEIENAGSDIKKITETVRAAGYDVTEGDFQTALKGLIRFVDDDMGCGIKPIKWPRPRPQIQDALTLRALLEVLKWKCCMKVPQLLFDSEIVRKVVK